MEVRNANFLDSVSIYLEGLVHPSAREDRRVLASHRSFIAVRLLSGLGALAVLPIHLAVFGAPGAIETAGYAWFLLPLAIVWHLSRTGDYERAHVASTIIFAAMVGLIASLTGGAASFVLPWLVVVPLESALYASRRTAIFSAAFALFTALFIWTGSALEIFPSAAKLGMRLIDPHLFSAFSATVYACVISFGAVAARKDHSISASEARYRLIAESTGELVTCHGRNGAVSFASPAAEKLLGAPPAQLMGHGFFDRVHVADRPAFLTAIAETAAKGEPSTIEYRLHHGPLAGREGASVRPGFVWVETRYRASGHQVIGATSDISARKNAETAVESAQLEVLRANETRSRLLATVSHELRTPLNAIIGFSEMLTRENAATIDAARREDYARLICDSGEHLLSVINGILDAAQIESGRLAISSETFAIDSLIESCREMMSLRAEQAGVALSIAIEKGLPEIVADRRALRQVIINLLSNAIKFTARGGRVSLAGRADQDDLLLIVSDSGIGISESDLANVGSPFFQASSSYSRAYEGTGLGLSVVKGLIELHGGSFQIESRLDEGTRVTVRLPFKGKAASTGKTDSVIEAFPSHFVSKESKKVKRSA